MTFEPGFLVGREVKHADPDTAGEFVGASGNVLIEPIPSVMRDADGAVVIRGSWTAPLEPDGSYSIAVPPTGWGGTPSNPQFNVTPRPSHLSSFDTITGVAVEAGQTLNVNNLVSVDPSPPEYPNPPTRQEFTALTETVGEKVDPGDLAPVATSGSYTDLDDKPAIPATAGDVGAETPAGAQTKANAAQAAATAAAATDATTKATAARTGAVADVAAAIPDPGTAVGAALLASFAGIREAAKALPRALGATTSLETTTTPRAMDHHGGYFWGTTSDNKLWKSADGTTWTVVATLTFRPSRLLPTSDGEMLAINGSEIRKSSGWTANPATATWAVKATTTGGPGVNSFANFGFDGDSTGTKFISVEYGADRSLSNKVYMSLDAGSTWFTAWDETIEWPTEYMNSHLHSCCYDEQDDRWWFSNGHNASRGLYYSEDDGTTWTRMPSDQYNPDGSPVTMIATRHGIVCGSDSPEAALWLIPRHADPTRMRIQILARWRGAVAGGAPGTATRSFKDSVTGLVYTIWSNAADTTYPSSIWVTDGVASREFYTLASATVARHVVAHNGVVRAQWTVGGTDETQVAMVASGDYPREVVINEGNIGGGTAATQNDTAVGERSSASGGSSLAAGTRATSLGQGVAVGDEAVTTGTGATSVGYKASAAASSTVVGNQALASGTAAIAVGRLTVALDNATVVGDSASSTGTSATVVGKGATGATSAVAVGSTATASATGAVAVGGAAQATAASTVSVGPSANASGVSAVAIGNGATAPGGSSVIIGKSAVGTASANTVAIGNAASVSAASAVAIGNGATSAFTNSVALGSSSTTTANDQVHIGARHLALTESATRPTAPSADGTRFYTLDDGSGNTVMEVRFNGTSKIIKLASQLGTNGLGGSDVPYTTAARPSAVTAGAGARYFDTTLGKPVSSNGTNWVDATGATV